MTTTTEPEEICPDPAPSNRPAGAADDRFLVRIPATDDSWLDRLPPAPGATRITVSLTDPSSAIKHAARLSSMGYVPVGTAGASADRRWADVVAPRTILESDTGWCEGLLTEGCRLYACAHGPVALLLGEILAAHRHEDSRAR